MPITVVKGKWTPMRDDGAEPCEPIINQSDSLRSAPSLFLPPPPSPVILLSFIFRFGQRKKKRRREKRFFFRPLFSGPFFFYKIFFFSTKIKYFVRFAVGRKKRRLVSIPTRFTEFYRVFPDALIGSRTSPRRSLFLSFFFFKKRKLRLICVFCFISAAKRSCFTKFLYWVFSSA